MPNVTVYIRTGDLEKWKQLQGKSEFIHNALKREPVFVMQQDKFMEFSKEKLATKDKWTGPIPKSVSARKKK